MSKHTAGPWEFGKQVANFRSGRKEWAVCSGQQTVATMVSIDAAQHNAALIAAAPDLLAALEKLIEFAQPALEAQGFGYMGSFEQARAAIAKAKGQQLT